MSLQQELYWKGGLRSTMLHSCSPKESRRTGPPVCSQLLDMVLSTAQAVIPLFLCQQALCARSKSSAQIGKVPVQKSISDHGRIVMATLILDGRASDQGPFYRQGQLARARGVGQAGWGHGWQQQSPKNRRLSLVWGYPEEWENGQIARPPHSWWMQRLEVAFLHSVC